MNIEELLEKAFAGNVFAQSQIVSALFAYPDHEVLKGRLKEFSDLGWSDAQHYYCSGLAKGVYGIAQDPTELKRQAHLGVEKAQEYYCVGLASGRFGIKQDIDELKELAYQGWKYAQEDYCCALDNGLYGLKKNEKLAKKLETLWNLND